MTLTVIGSGSAGNCYILQNETEALIIEAGLPFDKDVKKALGWDTSKIKAVIISHAHNDHAGYAAQYTAARIRVMALPDTIERKHLGMFATPYKRAWIQGWRIQGAALPTDPLQHRRDTVPELRILDNPRRDGSDLFFHRLRVIQQRGGDRERDTVPAL